MQDAEGRVHPAVLRGTGSQPQVLIEQAALDLGVASTSGVEGAVVVTNTGTWVLTLHDTLVEGPNAADFTLMASGDGAVLRNGEQTRIRLMFAPTAPGERTARLRFTSNAPNSPHEIALRGTGAAM